MNRRATSWILAALMTLCTAHAVPAVRSQRNPEHCAIVWIARARAEQHLAAEKRVAHPLVPSTLARPEEPAADDRLSSNSLYQRPPPLALL